MLDKSVPYAGLNMKREAGTPIAHFDLPDGFKFVYYSDKSEPSISVGDGSSGEASIGVNDPFSGIGISDAESWARIEKSVLEFDSVFAALLHFNEKFVPYTDDLTQRCIFIEYKTGEKVATATAWWSYVNGERRPWLHWVAVDPRYQGHGLGKALIAHIMRLMVAIEGDVDFFLHTQTWSYKAISIYKNNGFVPTKEKALYTSKGDSYRKAMRILKRLDAERRRKASWGGRYLPWNSG